MSANPPNTSIDPKTSTAERPRREIDSGRTGDKVGVSDPAASPVGTDSEAAEAHDEEELRIARQAPRPARPK